MKETSTGSYRGLDFSVDPEVYEPAEDTLLLADNLDAKEAESVLEIGTGCGLIAILAAKSGSKVVATDVNPMALECAGKNARVCGVADLIEFKSGELFEPVGGESFDLIVFNPPYLPIPRGQELGTQLDRAWEGGPDGRAVTDRFLAELPEHLKLGGRVLLVQSSLSGVDKTIEMLEAGGLRAEIAAREKVSFEELFLVRARRLLERGDTKSGRRPNGKTSQKVEEERADALEVAQKARAPQEEEAQA